MLELLTNILLQDPGPGPKPQSQSQSLGSRLSRFFKAQGADKNDQEGGGDQEEVKNEAEDGEGDLIPNNCVSDFVSSPPSSLLRIINWLVYYPVGLSR